MNNLGLGVMIGLLAGNKDSVEAYKNALGKTIVNIVLEEDNELVFTFSDNTTLIMWDAGQSCCEHRYLHTDDSLGDFVDSVFVNAEVRDAPNVRDDRGEVHEVNFLLITTSKGIFTIETHNEHNGYYGGFLIRCR